MSQPQTARRVLITDAVRHFVDCVESTGGVLHTPEDTYQPAADENWTDLGAAYVEACAALGIQPRVREKGECVDN